MYQSVALDMDGRVSQQASYCDSKGFSSRKEMTMISMSVTATAE